MGEELSKLNDRQVKIWEHLVENKIVTAKECESLFKDVSRKTINYDFKKMQDIGLLHSIGQSKATYYEPNF